MTEITYPRLDAIDAEELLPLLNSHRVRQHLIAHPLFTLSSLQQWLVEKQHVDATPGCRVRAIALNDELIGWCGIQRENDEYELAVVIGEQGWGVGKAVFLELMDWARAMGHREVAINFFHTRRPYRFLIKRAISVRQVELLGASFTRYQLAVD